MTCGKCWFGCSIQGLYYLCLKDKIIHIEWCDKN